MSGTKTEEVVRKIEVRKGTHLLQMAGGGWKIEQAWKGVLDKRYKTLYGARRAVKDLRA